jgi:hypothetical protein
MRTIADLVGFSRIRHPPFVAFRLLTRWQPRSSAFDQRVLEQWRQFAVGGDLGPYAREAL